MIAALLALAVAPPASAAPPAPPRDERVYRYQVKYGDSLIRLSQDYLSGPNAMRVVMRASRIPAARTLQVGEVLMIPYRVMRREPVDGKVIAFRGVVQLGGAAARVGAPVGEGMTIATGANASTGIRFPDGTVASIPSNSRVRVLTLSRYVLTGEVDREFAVDEGGSEWQVSPARNPGDRLRVRTPVAVSAVRGTGFRVTYRRAGTLSGASVVEGEVAFATRPGAATPLPKGFGAAADVSRKIDRRVLLQAPILASGFERQAGNDVAFALAPLPGARAYKAIVARDAGLVDIVGEATGAGPRLTLPAIGDGDYFVRVSAIDAVNLEGFARDAAFTRKFAPLTAGPVRAEGNFARFTWTFAGQRTGRLRFILSSRRDLSRPLIDLADAPVDGVIVANLPRDDYYWQVSSEEPGGTATTGIMSVKLGQR